MIGEKRESEKKFGKNVEVCLFCGELIDLDKENYGRLIYYANRKASTKFFERHNAKTCRIGVAHESCIEEELLTDGED